MASRSRGDPIDPIDPFNRLFTPSHGRPNIRLNRMLGLLPGYVERESYHDAPLFPHSHGE